jgi:4-amino-4-deoxy-L-arabinose transferase-like glycosyltransferase
MTGRRRLLAIVVLAAALHALGIARTTLPAQDGLKFIRIARQFQERPAIDVIRDSDRHPLYPALIALTEPLVAALRGHGPETWRIAAQGVAALAAIAAVFPLYGLARGLFSERIAALAVLLFVLLPLPSEVGRDTLSDSLGLLATLWALRLAAAALSREEGRITAFVGCGIASGLGYLARPEVVVVPLAVVVTRLLIRDWRPAPLRRAVVELSALSVAFLTLLGGYALAKGEVSEKLALRYGVGLARPRAAVPVRAARPWLPPGLDDPRWDFSPKEETLPGEAATAVPATAPAAIAALFARWAEGLGGFLGLFAIWGAVRAGALRTQVARQETPAGDSPVAETIPPRLRPLLTIYLALYSLALVHHLLTLRYLSDRHLLPLVAVSLSWAAAGVALCFGQLARMLGWSQRRTRGVGMVLVVLISVMVLAAPPWKPRHHSRWGHWAAGRWLQDHATAAQAILDTRGWASFVANRPSYDYWHVRQALTDPHLAYVVVGADELSAPSQRAVTLRAVLAYSARAVAAFPDDRGGKGIGVLVYRYQRPDSWEGLRP